MTGDRQTIVDGLRAQMQALGITAAELQTGDGWPTVAEAVADISSAQRHAKGRYSAKTLKDYRRNWTIFADRHGDESLASIHDEDIEEDLDWVHEQSEQRLALRNARRVERGQRPVDSSLHGAQEMYLSAVRAVFKRQYRHRRMDPRSSPAHMVEIGNRPPGRRRPLGRAETEDVFSVAISGGNDPMLDLIVVRGGYELGARQEGMINLRESDLDFARQTVWLDEKYGKRREQPASQELLHLMRDLGRERGATPTEPLLRYKPRGGQTVGAPLTSRRFDTLFSRVRSELTWADELMVGFHFLRHTMGRRIERFAGKSVARSFLGHAPADTTEGYTGTLDGEVAWAWSRVTHEPHPLAADAEEGW
jgi:integrase